MNETLRAVFDVFNNFLNKMRWFQTELQDHPANAAEHLRHMDHAIDQAAKELSAIQSRPTAHRLVEAAGAVRPQNQS